MHFCCSAEFLSSLKSPQEHKLIVVSQQYGCCAHPCPHTGGEESGKPEELLIYSLHSNAKKRNEQWMLLQHIAQKIDGYLMNEQ